MVVVGWGVLLLGVLVVYFLFDLRKKSLCMYGGLMEYMLINGMCGFLFFVDYMLFFYIYVYIY